MKRACVIGWPVEHSRSPVLHRYWLAQYGIDGAYEKEAVRPEDFAAFLRSLAERGYVGGNVTLPHKEAALAIADEADEAAKAIGAANTLWLDKAGRLQASNSDSYGFMAHLNEQTPDWNRSGRPALVLGAGGAARAIVHALLAAGAGNVLVANRTHDRAEALAKHFGQGVSTIAWEKRHEALAGCGLLVNATSLGMTGNPPLDIDLGRLPRDAIVADIVYSPLVTDLLATAGARGNRIVDGLGMLLHQAVPGFEHWFGLRPEVTPELRAHVAATLEGGRCSSSA